MTVHELYSFALDNCLVNAEVDEVIRQFNLSRKPAEKTATEYNKVEYSTQDVLDLFSSTYSVVEYHNKQ